MFPKRQVVHLFLQRVRRHFGNGQNHRVCALLLAHRVGEAVRGQAAGRRGGYGNVTDQFVLRCVTDNSSHRVFFDREYAGYVERRAIPESEVTGAVPHPW